MPFLDGRNVLISNKQVCSGEKPDPLVYSSKFVACVDQNIPMHEFRFECRVFINFPKRKHSIKKKKKRLLTMKRQRTVDTYVAQKITKSD